MTSNAPPRPPQASGSSLTLELTPEKVKQIEINRLRAKAKQRLREEEEAASSSSSSLNANRKRPVSGANVVTTSPTAPGKPKPLARDSRLMGKYFDYDLSKMVNSKGGFLVEDDKEVDEAMRIKEMAREKQRAKHNLEPRTFHYAEARILLTSATAIYMEPSLNPKCSDCQSMDIDHTYKKTFGCLVCNKCKNEKPERYSLLTKTECKEVR